MIIIGRPNIRVISGCRYYVEILNNLIFWKSAGDREREIRLTLSSTWAPGPSIIAGIHIVHYGILYIYLQ